MHSHKKLPLLRDALLLGIDGIPRSAKSDCRDAHQIGVWQPRAGWRSVEPMKRSSISSKIKRRSMSNLAKKGALVTGASRGIGAAIAKRRAADGASVAITYAKDASAASAVVKAIEVDGGKAIAIQADATDAEAVKGAGETTG